MLAGSGGGLGDCAGHGSGTAFGDDDAIGSRGVGGAQDGSEIVGIFDAVEYNDQRILISLGGDYVGEIVVLLGRCDGNDSLMRGVSGHAVEFGALKKAHWDADLSAIFDEALQAEIVALFGHADPFERASARLQRLGHRVDAVDVVHEVSVYRDGDAAIRRVLCHSARSEEPLQSAQVEKMHRSFASLRMTRV